LTFVNKKNIFFTFFMTNSTESRGQAPNVFINLETSNLTRRQIMSVSGGQDYSENQGAKKPCLSEGRRFEALTGIKKPDAERPVMGRGGGL
jgi:hypothetical protein